MHRHALLVPPGGRDVAALIAVPLASLGAGLLAQVIAGVVEQFWIGPWPRWLGVPDRALTTWRLRRWRRAQQRVEAGESPGGDLAPRDELVAARNRIALQEPVRPTWIGDRPSATDARIWQEYRLDLTFCWPRLWLVIPDGSREAVRSGREQFATAALAGGWAVLYAVLGLLWWPMLLVAVLVALVAWRSGRTGAAVLADLVEATVDVHARDLATALGVPAQDGQVTPSVGRQITQRLRKGV